MFSLGTYKYNQTGKKLQFASSSSFPTAHLCFWKKSLTISTLIQQAINMFMKITSAFESLPLSKQEAHFRGLPFSSLFITSLWSAFVFLLFLLYFGYWLCCFSRSTLESLLKKMEQLPLVAMMVHHIIYLLTSKLSNTNRSWLLFKKLYCFTGYRYHTIVKQRHKKHRRKKKKKRPK